MRDRIALITGSGRGTGREIALELARVGAHVIVNARANGDEAEGVCRQAREFGVEALAVIGDVSNEKHVRRMFELGVARFGRVDILVHCAAVRPRKPFLDLTFDDWRLTTGVILDGAFLCASNALPGMSANGWGRIVFISSAGAFAGLASSGHISAPKLALVALARSLATEFGLLGITVNTVCPGGIETDRNEGWFPDPMLVETMLGRVPLGRFAEPSEIAKLVTFLVSDDAGYITGETVHINGGLGYF